MSKKGFIHKTNTEQYLLRKSVQVFSMHNLTTNFDKINKIVKSSLSHELNSKDNLRFYPFIHEVTKKVSAELNEGESIFIIDTIPVPVCK